MEDAMKAGIHAVAALAALFLLDGCSEPSSTQTLQRRVAIRMDPAQTCNRPASIEYLPNGARVRMPDTSLFVVGRTDLSNCGQYAVSSVVEAMLDPRIMQVVVEPGGDFNAPYAFLPRERADNIRALLSNTAGTATQPPVLVQPAPAPSGSWGIVLAVADQ
jgi:hypothetical protein